LKIQALRGIKVVEFSDFVCGPYCTKLLATMGAEVIKVERPGLGDSARGFGPFPQDLPHPEKSGLFLFLNTNKYSITLDCETDSGLKIFKELLAWADVLVDTHLPKYMARLGLTYPKIHRINPKLIVASITPFGQTGPFRNYSGNDLIASHAGSEAFGNPDEGVKNPDRDPPLKGSYHASDIMCGVTGAACIVSALIASRNSGKGLHIDLSQQEAIASTGRQQLAFYAVQGLIPSRNWGRKKFGGFLYPCNNGYVVIWIGPHYQKVMHMLGDPDWAQEEIFANPLMRNDYIIELNQLISEWTLKHSMEEINSLASVHDVPCSPVRAVKEFVGDEQLSFREFWQELEHPVAGKLRYPGPPFKSSATPGLLERSAPLLGEHNDMVYCQILGHSRKEMVKLRQAGAI
jgi:crotonobetainyl-CoA:carnitine CoA-transferase CaiB-like acyl-CoA transferase